MKGQNVRGIAPVLVTLATMKLCGVCCLEAQGLTADNSAALASIDAVPVETVPRFGTFWSLQQAHLPPLPENPFPGLPAYWIGGNSFMVDDRAVNYPSLQEERMVDQALTKLELEYGIVSQSPSQPLYWGWLENDDPEPPVPATTAYQYRTNEFWVELAGVTNGLAWLTIHGTVPEEMYEVQSRLEAASGDWLSEGLVQGAGDQDWTPAWVEVRDRTNALFFRARSWADADGNGLPDWWEWEWLEETGVDSYGDGDQDGWANIQEWQNGTSPRAPDSPPIPNLQVTYYGDRTNALVWWGSLPPTATGFTLERYHIQAGQSSHPFGPGVTRYQDTALALEEKRY